MNKIKKSSLDLYIIGKVKEFRLKHRMTQADLAFEMNVSNGFIGKVESLNYASKYNLSHLNKIAKIFNCSIREFLPEQPIEKKY